MSDHYYDAGAGAWRDEDDASWLDERAEDDANEAPEARDEEGLPETAPDTRPRDAVHRSEPPERRTKQVEDDDDMAAERAFLAAKRGQRELSGEVRNFGRRRGNHGTGMRGRGLRGMREGTRTKGKSHTVLTEDLKPYESRVRPTGRNVGGRVRYPAPREDGSGTRREYLFKLATDPQARRALRRLVKDAYGITFDDVRKTTAIKGRPSKEIAPLRAKVAAAFAATVDFEAANDSQRGQGVAREALMYAYGLDEQQFDRLLRAGRESEGSKSKGA